MKRWFTLPPLAALLGASGFFLRRQELATAFDPETGLATLETWSFLLMMLGVLTALILLAGVWGVTISGDAARVLSVKTPLYLAAMVVSAGLTAAAGVTALRDFFAVLSQTGISELMKTNGWMLSCAILGGGALLVCPALLIPGVRAVRGTQPRGRYSFSVLLPGFLCCIWLISVYQRRSADPVILHYALPLIAIIAAAFAAYFMAGLSYGAERPRLAAFCGLFAACLCGASCADGTDAVSRLLYLAFWLYLMANATALLYNASRPAPAAAEDALEELNNE